MCGLWGKRLHNCTLSLTQILKTKNKHKNIIALAIDEGIKDYREHTLDFLTKFCKKYEIELHINSYKKVMVYL